MSADTATCLNRIETVAADWLDNALCGYITLDTDDRIQSMNACLAHWLGLGSAAAPPLTFREILTEGAASTWTNHIRRRLVNHLEAEEMYLDLKTGDGRAIPCLMNFSKQVRSGAPVIIHVAVMRTFSRRYYENDLLTQKQQSSEFINSLMTLLDGTTDCVLLAQRDLRVTFANSSARERFGELPVKTRSVVELVAGPDQASIRELQARIDESNTDPFVLYRSDLDVHFEIRMRPEPSTISFFIRDVTHRVRAERDLAQMHAQINTMIAYYSGGITFYDADLQMISCNNSYRELMDLPDAMFSEGYPSLREIFRYNIARGEYGPERSEADLEEMLRIAKLPVPSTIVRTRPNGRVLEIKGMPVPGGGFVTTCHDVTAHRQLLRQLEEKNRFSEQKSRELELVLAHMKQGVSVYDSETRLLHWNANYLKLFELDPQRIVQGMTLAEVLDVQKSCDNFPDDIDSFVENLFRKTRNGVSFTNVERFASGKVIRSTHSPSINGGWVATHDDITEDERARQKIIHAAHHDPLTEIHNRAGLQSHLGAILRDCIYNGVTASILMIDLDRFKQVNDSYGHSIGDKVLQQAARRMLDCVRRDDLVARLGGDEFAVVIRGSDHQSPLLPILAERLVTALEKPFLIGENEILIGASIGIASAPAHGLTADDLLHKADQALYAVKRNGRNGFRIFFTER